MQSRMPTSVKRRLAVAIPVLSLLVFGAWRTYRAFIPSGASFLPFVLARVEGPLVRRGDGSANIRVWYNDAGAAHSGNHWTWFVSDHWFFGKKVVAEGYLGAEHAVDGARPRVDWIGRDSFRVVFLSGRYSSDPEERIIELN